MPAHGFTTRPSAERLLGQVRLVILGGLKGLVAHDGRDEVQ